MKKPSKPYDYMVNVCILLFSILIFILCLEVVLRVSPVIIQEHAGNYPPHTFKYNERLGFVHTPNFKGSLRNPEFVTLFEINNIGMRDEYFDKENDVGGVLVLGDSFTFGHGVNQDEVYVSLLEKEFDYKYKFWNAAVSAYGTNQELLYFIDNADIIKPKAVILGFFLNDLADNLGRRMIWLDSDNKTLIIKPLPAGLKRVKVFFRENTYFYPFIIDRIKSIRIFKGMLVGVGLSEENKNEYSFQNDGQSNPMLIGELEVMRPYLRQYSPKDDYGWLLTEALIGRLNEEGLKRNIKFYVVIFPAKEQTAENLWNLRLSSLNISSEEYDMDKPTEILKSYLEKEGIPYIDLLPYLRNHSDPASLYYKKDRHWNKEGHILGAKLIKEDMDKRGILD